MTPEWVAAINSFIAWQQGRRRAAGTQAHQRYRLALLAVFIGKTPAEVNPGDIGDWFDSMECSEAETVARASALRTFFGWAVSHGLVASDPTLTAAPNRRDLRRQPRSESWRVAMAGWLEWRLAAGIASTSLKTQCWHLVHAADALSHIDPLEVTYSDLIRHMASTAEWSPDARRQHRSTIRGFYKWCVLTEQLSKDPAYNLPSIKAPIGEPNPVPDDVIAEALARASWSPKLRAMILLAACCGLRRAEIATLRTSNVQGAELRVTGKGRRVRMVPMPDLVIQALMALEADPAGYVFPGETPKGHIGVEWVGDAISNALPPPWTAHKLRHRFATAAYDVERDLLAVQRLLGHTSPATTQIYTRVRNDARRRAVDGAAEAFA